MSITFPGEWATYRAARNRLVEHVVNGQRTVIRAGVGPTGVLVSARDV